MRAVAYRLSRLIRARWGATAVLSLIVAVLAGVAISCAAGARRTTSAPDRYVEAAGGGFDAQITQETGAPRIDEIRQLPAVEDVESMTFVFGGLAKPGTDEGFDAFMFAGSPVPSGTSLISGRAPDRASRNEFVATRTFVESNGVSVGDSFDVVTLTPEQQQAQGFDVSQPEGPRWSATLVGVIDGPTELDDTGSILVFSPELLNDPNIAIASSVMWVAERDGADGATLRAQLDSLPNNEEFTLENVLVSADVRTAVRAQGRGLWVLAAVSAVAAIAVLGQLITRAVRLSVLDRERLSALGFTNGQILAESVGRAALPIGIGSVLAATLAIVPSGLFPTGFVKLLEPDPGIDVDLDVLLIGASGFLVTLTGWTLIALLLTTRKAKAVRPSQMLETIALRAPTAAAATGLRFAFTRRGKDRGSVRGAIAGLVLTVGALVGALTFGVSLNRLVDDPARFGRNYDISTDDGAEVIPAEVIDIVEHDPDIASAMLYAITQARSGSETVDLIGMQPVRGDIRPRTLEGRLPDAQDEIALGRVTSRKVGAGIGDTLALVVGETSRDFRVTGIAVLPGLSGGNGVGDGGVLTLAGLQQLEPEAVANIALIDVRDDAPPETFQRLAESVGVQGGPGDQPGAIVNLKRVRTIPFVLTGVLAALSILTVAHVMLTSLRNGRRDLAILRAIGADQGWIARTMHWQVTAFALVPIICGAAVGIVAGRMVFTALADSVGAVNDAVVPFTLIGVVALASLVLSNGTATVPAHRARRAAAATVLQAE